jgi:Restriction endonuclease.
MFFKKRVNDGKNYEELLHYVYTQLSFLSGKDIKVQKNVKIEGKSGEKHQIDVYYEFKMNNMIHKVAIECKDYKSKVPKEKVEAFISVLNDIGGCRGIIASRAGFQSGAINFAKFNDIDLVTGGELPLLCKVIANKLELVLPDKDVIGQPFWTIMEEESGKLTGTYICVGENKTIGLFMTKKAALEVAEKSGGVVRGISQKHLKIVIEYAKKGWIKIAVFLLFKEQMIQFEKPEDIEELFYVE